MKSPRRDSPWSTYAEQMSGPTLLESQRMRAKLSELPAREARSLRQQIAWAMACAAAIVLCFAWLGREWPMATGSAHGDMRSLMAAGSVASHAPARVRWMAPSDRAQIEPLALGGRLTLAPEGSAQLRAGAEFGCVVELVWGRVELDVRSGPGLNWVVETQGYRVRAIGTKFSVEVTGDRPWVEVEHGIVEVSGPDLLVPVRVHAGQYFGRELAARVANETSEGTDMATAEPQLARAQRPAPVARPQRPAPVARPKPRASEARPTAAGARLRPKNRGEAALPRLTPSRVLPQSRLQGRATPAVSSRPHTAPDPADDAQDDSAVPTVVEPELDTPEPSRESPVHSPPAWLARFRQSMATGDLLAAAQHIPRDFLEPNAKSNAKTHASAADYLNAGDALESAGRPRAAARAYAASCRRGPRARACGVSYLRRARMAAAQADLRTALRWLDAYSRKFAQGDLQAEADGLRITWLWQRARHSAARRDARRYLARWPNGPYASFARSILVR